MKPTLADGTPLEIDIRLGVGLTPDGRVFHLGPRGWREYVPPSSVRGLSEAEAEQEAAAQIERERRDLEARLERFLIVLHRIADLDGVIFYGATDAAVKEELLAILAEGAEA